MSDAPAPSNSPSSDSAFGRVAEERKHGFTQMPTHDGEPPKPKRDFATAREAGEELEGKRRRTGNVEQPVEEIAYRNRDGSTADPKETITLNRAADDRKEFLDARAKMAETIDNFDVADSVEQRRVAEGIAATEPSQPQLEQPHADPAAQQFERDAVEAGVDPELAKVLRNRQARQALESEFEKVGKLQAEHAQQIQVLQHFARENWLAGYPELARLPVDQIAPALNQMAQTNPQRAQAAVASLRRVGEAAVVHEQHQAQRAHVERQQFQANAKIQDAQFEKMIGPQTPQQRQAASMEMVAYAAEMGIDRSTLIHLLQTNPILRHSAFQHMIHTAVTARIAKREGAKYREKIDRTVPPVNRPGHTNSPRGNRGNENLAALAQKANSSGSLKDMAALLAAKRRGR
jgi:hypothetical protein